MRIGKNAPVYQLDRLPPSEGGGSGFEFRPVHMEQKYRPLTKEQYNSIKKGDVIERMLAFAIPMYLIVQSVEDGVIDAGWTFDANTGLEIDEGISVKVSYISKVLTEEEKLAVKEGGKLVSI
jgi:hypothetical protein